MSASQKTLRPAVARIWRGCTAPGMADEYARYLFEHGIKPLAETALHVEMLEHHVAVGLDKEAVKEKMRALKEERQRALEAHDHPSLKSIRRQMHHLNHQIRSHMS